MPSLRAAVLMLIFHFLFAFLQRSVTVEIHNDTEDQRAGLLSNTSDAFDNFGTRLNNSSQHLTRTIRQGARQHRTTLYIVAGMFGLFILYKIFL
jgi:hypothetical protein